MIEPEGIDSRLLFVFLKTEFAINQLVRRTRATMYPAVNPEVDVPEIIVPKCIFNVEDEIKKLVDKNMNHLSKWRLKLIEIDEKINEKFDVDSFEIPETYEKSTIVNRKKLMNFANRCDAEFFDSFYDHLDKHLGGHKLISLSSITEPGNGLFTGKTPARNEYVEDETKPQIIKVASLSNRGINWDDVEFVPESFLESNKKSIVDKYDILLTSSAHSREHIAKKIDVVNDNEKIKEGRCLFVGELMAIRLKEEVEISPYYLASFLRTTLGKLQIQRCIRGITSHIYPEDLLNFIHIPITDENFMNEISLLVKQSEKERNKGRECFFEAREILVNEINKNLNS